MCKMNMVLHGIEDCNIQYGDVLGNPKLVEGGKLKTYDKVLANFPADSEENDILLIINILTYKITIHFKELEVNSIFVLVLLMRQCSCNGSKKITKDCVLDGDGKKELLRHFGLTGLKIPTRYNVER
jgi:type I restriction-modification system DNA methylase subunit